MFGHAVGEDLTHRREPRDAADAKHLEYHRRYTETHREERAISRARWWAEHSEARRQASLKERYGVVVDYAGMLADQGGVCAICGRPPKGTGRSGLHIDHNHTTGKIRGLLCAGCNIRVGHYEKPFHEKTLAYLAKHT